MSFTGMLVHPTPVYFRWISRVSFLKYGNAALLQNEMQGLVLQHKGSEVPGERVLEHSETDNGLDMWANVGILFGIMMGLKVLNMFLLYGL